MYDVTDPPGRHGSRGDHDGYGSSRLSARASEVHHELLGAQTISIGIGISH
jgi:hypothetical protein